MTRLDPSIARAQMPLRWTPAWHAMSTAGDPARLKPAGVATITAEDWDLLFKSVLARLDEATEARLPRAPLALAVIRDCRSAFEQLRKLAAAGLSTRR